MFFINPGSDPYRSQHPGDVKSLNQTLTLCAREKKTPRGGGPVSGATYDGDLSVSHLKDDQPTCENTLMGSSNIELCTSAL